MNFEINMYNHPESTNVMESLYPTCQIAYLVATQL